MKRILDYYFPHYWTDTDEDGNFIVIIYPTHEDKMNFTNGKSYRYSMSLSPNVSDSECCKVKIDGKYYYFG